MPRLWASAASLRNQRSSPPRTSMHQSLKLLRNPWGTEGIPNRRSKAVYTMSDRGFRFPAGNTRPLSCPSNSRAWDRISRARPVSGTPVPPSGLHPRRRDLPGGGFHLHLLPHGQTGLTGPGSGQDQELEGEPGHPVGGGLPDLSQCIRHIAIGKGRMMALEPGDSGQGPENGLSGGIVRPPALGHGPVQYGLQALPHPSGGFRLDGPDGGQYSQHVGSRYFVDWLTSEKPSDQAYGIGAENGREPYTRLTDQVGAIAAGLERSPDKTWLSKKWKSLSSKNE